MVTSLIRGLTLICLVFTLLFQTSAASASGIGLLVRVASMRLIKPAFRAKTLAQLLALEPGVRLGRQGKYVEVEDDPMKRVERLAAENPDSFWSEVKYHLVVLRHLQSRPPSFNLSRQPLDSAIRELQEGRLTQEAKNVAVREALETEKVLLYDAWGRAIEANNRQWTTATGSRWSSAISEFQQRASRIIVEVLDSVPPSEFESARALKEALDKGFQKYWTKYGASWPSGDYNVSTGKLTLYTADRIRGEVNACQVVFRILDVYCNLHSIHKDLFASDSEKINCKPLQVPEKLCGAI